MRPRKSSRTATSMAPAATTTEASRRVVIDTYARHGYSRRAEYAGVAIYARTFFLLRENLAGGLMATPAFFFSGVGQGLAEGTLKPLLSAASVGASRS
jgi:hypothetical protein